jgi:hypothetical protein
LGSGSAAPALHQPAVQAHRGRMGGDLIPSYLASNPFDLNWLTTPRSRSAAELVDCSGLTCQRQTGEKLAHFLG